MQHNNFRFDFNFSATIFTTQRSSFCRLIIKFGKYMSSKEFPFIFDPSKKGLRKILGELEIAVLEMMWEQGEASVREVFEYLKPRRDIAYTTVMTVMSRLANKGLLEKTKRKNAYLYRPAYSKKEFTDSTVKRIITELIDDFTSPALNYFIDSMNEENPEKMAELARLIKEKRKKKDV